ncbi:response regulator [Moraxellaceae bacterium AER2_44_116]|nr:response regulator [Moraxellaceae bacterium AER2_44_116]
MSKQAIRFDILSIGIACLLCCFFSCVSYASVQIDEQFTEQRLAPEISYVCDDIDGKTLNEVKQLHFEPLNSPEISFGFRESACWFRFQAANITDQPLQLVLSSDFNIFDKIEFYEPQADKTIRKSVGDALPYNARELKIRTLAIPFIIPAKQTYHYYIYAETTDTFYLPLRLSQYNYFSSQNNRHDSLISLTYGVVIGLFLYHFLLFFLTREKVQLLYFYYVFSTLLFFASSQGSLFQFWPNSPQLNNKMVDTFSFLTMGSACLFARNYLHTKANNTLHRFLKTCAIVFSLCAIIHIVIPTYIIAPLNTLLSLITVFLLFFVGVKRWLEGLNEARLFIISWGLLIIVGAYFILLLIFGGNEISNALFYTQLAFAAQQILLSIGLAQRLKALQKEKEAKEQEMLVAQAESAAKTDFLARMSHEIRTPMNAVIGVTQLLEATTLTESQHHYLSLLQNSGQLLLSIIDDILDYSKITSGNINLESTPFDIQKLIHNIYQILSANQEEKPVELLLNMTDDFPQWVEGDPTRLRQILFNLLNNALKFTTEGHVSLHAQRVVQIDKNNVQVQLTIIDTGIGLSQEQIAHLFTAFHQADASITRKYGGTGLGLAISKQLIELMGGSLHVSSKLGHGSSFVILLPLILTEELITITNPKMHAMPWADGGLSKLRILLTEDNAVNQLIISSLIRQLGIEVQLAKNGEEAFGIISKHHDDFDVILMDCEMPILDGLQATRKIRHWESEQQKSPITIIALTAHALPEYQIRCRDAGMNDYMTKPLLLNELAKKLQLLIHD